LARTAQGSLPDLRDSWDFSEIRATLGRVKSSGWFMKRLVLTGLAVLGLLAPAALADQASLPPPEQQSWLYVRFDGGAMAWNLHAGSWHDNNDRAEGEGLLYYSPPMEVDGAKIVWAREFWRIRCAANTYQVLRGEELNGGLGTVFQLKESQPSPIAQNSTQSVLKRVYCDNVMIAEAQSATGLLGVMEGILGADPLAPK
jgi:hypothetical protein